MITIANHLNAVINCHVAETIEKRHNLLSHGEMLENVRPRSIIEKIPAEGDGLSITMQEELNTITLPFYT